MTLTSEEHDFINSLPKAYQGCAIQQKEKDRKLRAALTKALGNKEYAATAMEVFKSMR